MMAHTPGPWQTARWNPEAAWVEVETVERGAELPEQGNHIATVGAYGDGPGPDANLISAAPELLEACRKLMNPGGEDASYLKEARALARQAIAKAEGNAQ